MIRSFNDVQNPEISRIRDIYILKVFAFPLFLCSVSLFFFSTSGTATSNTQVLNVDTLQENSTKEHQLYSE